MQSEEKTFTNCCSFRRVCAVGPRVKRRYLPQYLRSLVIILFLTQLTGLTAYYR